MLDFIETLRSRLARDVLTDAEIQTALPGSDQRRYGLIKRAIARGALIHVRRGLYVFAERYRRFPLDLFALAQKIYGPSYISLESALAFHGWIPEAVPIVASASSRRSRTYETSLGTFTYGHIPCEPFLAGVSLVSTKDDSFFMASPLKALTDFVYLFKKEWRGIQPLLISLRIEEEVLRETTTNELELLAAVYRSRRVKRFLAGVRKDLGL